MSEFIIAIDTSNAAFHPVDEHEDSGAVLGYELARIMRRLADKFEEVPPHCGTIFDSNGNEVGYYKRINMSAGVDLVNLARAALKRGDTELAGVYLDTIAEMTK